MMKITLNEDVVAFDGEVLECFFMDGSRRYHITRIKGIQLEPGKKGKYMLTIKLKYDPVFLWANEEDVPKVNELIAEVQRAMKPVSG